MNFPISSGSATGLILAAVFGVLLNKGRVTDYNVIVNLFRFKDMTVLKIMLTAIIVGGLGVWAMVGAGWIGGYAVKAANLLAVTAGSALFGVGMALYGFCPGTGIAAAATGRIHAIVGLFGMLAGGIAYAASFSWIKTHVLPVGAVGKVRLPEVTGIPTAAWWAILVTLAAILFSLLERHARRSRPVSL